MIAVISPAKTLDFETSSPESYSLPRFPKQTQELINVLRKKQPEDIQELMDVSEKIAHLNVDRYHKFSSKHTARNAKQCGYAFKGDVYLGLEAERFSEEDVAFAQSHLRILSGLYGLLRPLDRIQPYRLEMGTKLAFDDYNTLYNYWEDKIVKLLRRDLKAQGDDILINLASVEYFTAIDIIRRRANVIDIEFKDFKNGQYKIISFYAKKARGMMSRYIIENRINEVEHLKGFDFGGYYFDVKDSSENKLAFKRG
jgi:cytoplasmic iron level regulating protein YaaA (DUF328/UPF0246 family)